MKINPILNQKIISVSFKANSNQQESPQICWDYPDEMFESLPLNPQKKDYADVFGYPIPYGVHARYLWWKHTGSSLPMQSYSRNFYNNDMRVSKEAKKQMQEFVDVISQIDDTQIKSEQLEAAKNTKALRKAFYRTDEGIALHKQILSLVQKIKKLENNTTIDNEKKTILKANLEEELNALRKYVNKRIRE